MELTFRAARSDDLPAVRNLPSDTFCPRASSQRLESARYARWSCLLENPSTIAMTIEDRGAQPARMVAFGQVNFVTDRFAASVLRAQNPGAFESLLAGCCDGLPPWLTTEELRRLNSTEGLTAFVSYWAVASDGLSIEDQIAARDCLAHCFYEHQAGYNLKECLMVLAGDEALRIALNFGLRLRSEYPGWMRGCQPRTGPRPYLVGLTRVEALGAIGAAAHHLFVYHSPRFHFTPHDQELLALALESVTDEEIAAALHLTAPAVKKRWLSVFDRVSAVDPDLLPYNHGGRRGPEKRRILLRYLHEHPEELRPSMPPGLAS